MARVVVAGSINMDVVASTSRHPQPGETVLGRDLKHLPGGKGANQAVASAQAGAAVTMIGAVGGDAYGEETLRFLDAAGVNLDHVARREGTATGTALITVDGDGENTIVVAPGANATVDDASLVGSDAGPGDVVVAQYETPLATTISLFQRSRPAGATCLLNPAPALPTPVELLELTDVLVVNETELAALSSAGIATGSSDDQIIEAIARLHEDGFSGTAIATLGARGVLAAGRQRVRVPGHTVPAVDSTGAGDCFVGSLAAELAKGPTMQAAIEYANAAAALCVTRSGAGPAMPTRAEVEAFRR